MTAKTFRFDTENISGSYQNFCAYAGKSEFTGSFQGGADGEFKKYTDEVALRELSEYEKSLNSIGKSDLAKKMLNTLDALFNEKSSGDQNERVKHYLNKVSKLGNFKNHEKVCHKIATAINKAFGETVVTASLPAKDLCLAVREVLLSLTTSMHVEFINVRNACREVLNRIESGLGLITELTGHLKNKGANVGQEDVNKVSSLFDELHSEMNRQVKLLRNLLNLPTSKISEVITARINKLKGNPYIEDDDDKAFNKLIKDTLNSIGVTAYTAQKVENALKQFGMSIKEYINSNNLENVLEKVYASVGEGSFNREKVRHLNDYLRVIQNNFTHREELGQFTGSADDATFSNNAPTEEVAPQSKLSQALQDKSDIRSASVVNFDIKFRSFTDAFLKQLDALSKKMKTVKDPSPLLKLRVAIARLSEEKLNSSNSALVLSGYKNDINSISDRDDIYIAFSEIASASEEAASSVPEVSSELRSMASTIHSFLKQADFNFDKFRKERDTEGYGVDVQSSFGTSPFMKAYAYDGQGEDDDCEDKIKDAIDDHESRLHGAYEGGVDSELKNAIKKSMKSFKKSIIDMRGGLRKIDYYLRMSHIRANMRTSAKSLETDTKDYDEMTGRGIAGKKDEVYKEYQGLYEKLKDAEDLSADAGAPPAGVDNVLKEDRKKAYSAARSFLEKQQDARLRFWATCETIDNYLKLFTNAMMKNADELRNLSAMMENVQVINNWYNNSSGNNLSLIFECFPSYVSNEDTTAIHANRLSHQRHNALDNTTNDVVKFSRYYTDTDLDNSHYYDHIGSKIDAGNPIQSVPGNPLLPSHGEYFNTAVKKTVSVLNNLSILKNLLSVFVYLGSNIEGSSPIYEKAYMTPAEIHKNLIDYITYSSFISMMQVDGGKIENVAGTRLSNMTYNPLSENAEPYTNARAGNPIANTYDGTQDVDFKLTVNNLMNVGGTNRQYNKAYMFYAFVMKNSRVNAFKGSPLMVEEDRLFTIMMKSICAKIFTVIGSYDIFERPETVKNVNYHFRTIIGGATPTIKPEYVQTYIRLPLLANFYKRLFAPTEILSDDRDISNSADPWNNRGDKLGETLKYSINSDTNRLAKISLVPDANAPFGKLLATVFKTAYTSNDLKGLSDNDVNTLIEEINKIVPRLGVKSKSGHGLAVEVAQALADDVNRRYGILTKEDQMNIEQERLLGEDFDVQFSAETYKEVPLGSDYPILPGEDNMSARGSSNPSNRYAGRQSNPFTRDFTKTRKFKYQIHKEHMALVFKFRCLLDLFLNGEVGNDEYDDDKTLVHEIKRANDKIAKEQDSEKRYKLTRDVMLGSSGLYHGDYDKYLMFHDTVVSGLSLLNGIRGVLEKISTLTRLTDLKYLRALLIQWLKEGIPIPAANAEISLIQQGFVPGNQLVRNANLPTDNNAFSHYVLGQLNMNNADGQSILQEVLGRSENTRDNGGSATDPNAMIYSIKNKGDNIHANVSRISARRGGRPEVSIDNAGAIALVGHGGNTVHGLLTILNGDDRNAIPAEKLALLQRYVFSRDFIMEVLLNNLLTLSQGTHGLVSYDISGCNLLVNFEKLKSSILNLFDSVKHMANKLKPHIEESVWNKYCKYDDNSANSTETSLYHIEDQLINTFIKGRRREKVNITNLPNDKVLKTRQTTVLSLDQIGKIMNDTFEELTKSHKVDGSNLSTMHNGGAPVASANNNTGNAHGAVATSNNDTKNDSFGDNIARFLYYDINRSYSGLNVDTNNKEASLVQTTGGLARGGTELSDVEFMANNSEMRPYLVRQLRADQHVNGRLLARLSNYYNMSSDNFGDDRSILFALNQLVAKIIRSSKIGDSVFKDAVDTICQAFPEVCNKPLHGFPDLVLTASEKQYIPIKDWSKTKFVYRLIDDPTGGGDNVGIGSNVYVVGQNGVETLTNVNTMIRDGALAINDNAKINGCMTNPEPKYRPKPQSILMGSLGLIMNNIKDSTDKDGNYTYIADDLSKISKQDKERLRYNYMQFITHLTILEDKCKIFRKLFTDKNIKHGKNFNNAFHTHFARGNFGNNTMELGNAATNYDHFNPWPRHALEPEVLDAENNRRYHKELLMGLLSAIKTLKTGLSKSLMQLGGESLSKHGDLHVGFLQNVRTQHGKLPYAPVSMADYVLSPFNHKVDTETPDDNHHLLADLLPSKEYGYGKHGFNHALLPMLHKNGRFNKDDYTTFYQQISEYEKLMPKLNKSFVDSYIESYAGLARYVHHIKNLSELSNPIANVSLINTVSTLTVPAIPARGTQLTAYKAFSYIKVYSNPPTNINVTPASCFVSKKRDTRYLSTLLMDNDDTELKYEIISCIKNEQSECFRRDIINIFDLNVMPLNVHMLSREIPLANLYNYAYTFDRMVISMVYGEDHKYGRHLIRGLCDHDEDSRKVFNTGDIKDTKTLFVRLLQNPYGSMAISKHKSGKYINPLIEQGVRMFYGDDDMNIGRPKFLSDQIFNKVMFGDLYIGNTTNSPQYLTNPYQRNSAEDAAVIGHGEGDDDSYLDDAESEAERSVMGSGGVYGGVSYTTASVTDNIYTTTDSRMNILNNNIPLTNAEIGNLQADTLANVEIALTNIINPYKSTIKELVSTKANKVVIDDLDNIGKKAFVANEKQNVWDVSTYLTVAHGGNAAQQEAFSNIVPDKNEDTVVELLAMISILLRLSGGTRTSPINNTDSLNLNKKQHAFIIYALMSHLRMLINVERIPTQGDTNVNIGGGRNKQFHRDILPILQEKGNIRFIKFADFNPSGKSIKDIIEVLIAAIILIPLQVTYEKAGSIVTGFGDTNANVQAVAAALTAVDVGLINTTSYVGIDLLSGLNHHLYNVARTATLSLDKFITTNPAGVAGGDLGLYPLLYMLLPAFDINWSSIGMTYVLNNMNNIYQYLIKSNVDLGELSYDYMKQLHNQLPQSLHYINDETLKNKYETGNNPADVNAVNKVNVGNMANVFRMVGKVRFDTNLIRNLLFITNAYRITRYKLYKDLTFNEGFTAKGNSFLNPENTEYSGNESAKTYSQFIPDYKSSRYTIE